MDTVLFYLGRVRITRYPGRDHRQGGENFFSKKIWGAETFFTKKNENSRFHFSKKAIFEDQKVIYVGSSDSSVFIGV